eukprot:gb/GFBE01004557.1/.p1 GENE.gb/GFBE01004557.1/~~gb/GFBE01004557.1/.p1  ORF type:complete len:379 (+),score=64.84 gb/GFBE01004557.1/:1-1137(+)
MQLLAATCWLAACQSRLSHCSVTAVILAAAAEGGLRLCARAEELLEDDDLQHGEDDWSRLTAEDWRPGDMGNSRTSVPMKDLECEGEAAALQHSPVGITWVDVKALMHMRPRNIAEDRDLFAIAAQIQRDESDNCVLGIACTSAVLLPITMPRFRNLARVLTNDQNFLFLNVTFYDTMRSGFPIFGILDDLATEEYRSWFGTAESRQFFEPHVEKPACRAPAAQALRLQVERLRQERPREDDLVDLGQELLLQAVDVYASSEVDVPGSAAGCRPAAAVSVLAVALSRLQAYSSAAASRSSEAGAARYPVLRDVIELVARSEELIRDYCWDEGIPFGMLVATPWNLWWLLQQMQFALQRFLGHSWKLPSDEVQRGKAEL